MRRSGDGREEGTFNLLIPFLLTLVTLALCKEGQMEHAGWKKNPLQITFLLNFLNSALTCLSRASSLSLPASVLPFPHCLSFTHKATCVLCLLQLCKQERPLGLALIGEHLRAPPTCICLFRMPRTTSNLYLLH